MRFLVDVNASGTVARWLAAMGHDVVEVAHRDSRLPDEQVLQWAVSERRIIVTTDPGFEEMVWRAGRPHCGILRLENLPRAQRKALLEDVLARHSGDLQSGAIVIALSRKTRIRKPIGR